MQSPSLLIIGGSGIIGQQTACEAVEQGFSVTSIGLEESARLPAAVDQYIVDRTVPRSFERFREQLDGQHWDIVLDVINFSREHVEQTLRCFGKDAHTFFLSTTLVYDRKKQPAGPIPSSFPLARKGELGGYVDRKLEVEETIRTWRDAVKWTILRPYHVLGPASTTGCVPLHNRDPLLPERIRRGETLKLCDTTLCVVHPRDIGKTVLAAAHRDVACGKAYNVVNADVPVTTEQYHHMIGDMVGREPVIERIYAADIWKQSQGWALTALPEHRYAVDDLRQDIGYAPDTLPQQCIADALRNPVHTPQMHERMNLKPAPLEYSALFKSS